MVCRAFLASVEVCLVLQKSSDVHRVLQGSAEVRWGLLRSCQGLVHSTGVCWGPEGYAGSTGACSIQRSTEVF